MSESTPMKIAIRNTLITWGIPILMASIPYITWIDEVAYFMRMIGWRVVAIATSLHIFLTTFLFIKWIGIKKDLMKIITNISNQFQTMDTGLTSETEKQFAPNAMPITH